MALHKVGVRPVCMTSHREAASCFSIPTNGNWAGEQPQALHLSLLWEQTTVDALGQTIADTSSATGRLRYQAAYYCRVITLTQDVNGMALQDTDA